MTLTTGQVLQNRYRTISLLGQGGMGAVYRAWDMRLDVVVALKEMTSQPGLDTQTLAQLRQQFQQEAMTLARIHHPHLVRVTDFFEEGDNAYLVMDFVEGENLAHRIEREGALLEAQVLKWADHLLGALAHCHAQGVIHRDVKPHNVIIRPDGQAVLVDFGLVKLWDPHDPRTRTAIHAMGTPEYAPPEQYDTQMGHTDPRSDIYSLGATLYHALTGQAPPTATMRIASPGIFQPPRAMNPHLSPSTEAAVLRATELAVGNRFSTAQEMAAVLRGEIPVPAPPVAPQVQIDEATRVIPGAVPVPPARRKRVPVWAWVLGGLAALALVVVGGIGVWNWKGSPTPTPAESRVAAAVPTATKETSTPLASPSPTRTEVTKPTDTPTKTPTRTKSATSTPAGTVIGTPKGTPSPTATPTARVTSKASPTSKTPTHTPQPTSPPSSGALITFEQWGTWRRGDQPYGELTQTQAKVRSGSYAAKLRYDFPVTDADYVVFVRSMSLTGQPNTIGAWVYGDGSGHFLNVWVQDAHNEIWSVHLGQVGSSGWRQMAGTLASNMSWPSGHISGPENGVVDYPIRFYALVLDRTGSGSRSGQIYVDDISVWRSTTSATATPPPRATSTSAAGGPTPTAPSPSPTPPPPPPGQVGRVLYTIEAGAVYYLGSTDPSWSQGQVIGPIDYARSTCAGGSTVTTLEGQAFSLFYGYRCGIAQAQECPSPDGVYKVTVWESAGNYSLSVRQVSDDALVQAIYTGPLNTREPILWTPDGSYFYFTIDHTLHRASPSSAGYQAVIPVAYEPYLSPDGSMILYRQPVGTVGAYDVLVVNADGSNPHNITNAPEVYKQCARWGGY